MEEHGVGGSHGGLSSPPGQRSDRGTPAGPPAPPPSPARRRPAAAPRPGPGAPVTPSPAPSSRAPRHAPAALRQAQPESGTRRPGKPSSRREQARPRNSSSSRAVSGAGRDARAFPAGPRAAGPALPGVQPACPNAAVGRKRGRGRAPAAASRLRPPVPRAGRLPLSLPPSLQPCPSLCSPGPRRAFTCRGGAERGPGASGSRRRQRTPSRCCRPRVRRAGRSRDLPREALRKPAAAAVPAPRGGKEGGRGPGRPLRHPATGLSAPADRAAGSAPYPSAQRAARIPDRRSVGLRSAGGKGLATIAPVGGRPGMTGPVRSALLCCAPHSSLSLSLSSVGPGRRRAAFMSGPRRRKGGGRRGSVLCPGCTASRPPGERRAVRLRRGAAGEALASHRAGPRGRR
ncbi:translation initiation factor IF-2-like [Onychostruthus taczanowskii]|uniref:translation initiation factor IF-2-like n=1 Tax=Onychostruthus taczanowskii TaxID=356909 RepID=UPI001B80CB07|nr:translation initiation factor IF-2-like [Onychostruthus taczanowskii]